MSKNYLIRVRNYHLFLLLGTYLTWNLTFWIMAKVTYKSNTWTKIRKNKTWYLSTRVLKKLLFINMFKLSLLTRLTLLNLNWLHPSSQHNCRGSFQDTSRYESTLRTYISICLLSDGNGAFKKRIKLIHTHTHTHINLTSVLNRYIDFWNVYKRLRYYTYINTWITPVGRHL